LIGSDLTCGDCEDVYAGSERDIVNVSLPTMTLNHLLVKLSLDMEGQPLCSSGAQGEGGERLAMYHRERLLELLVVTDTTEDIGRLHRKCSRQPHPGNLAERYARPLLYPTVDFDTFNQPWLRFLSVSHGHPYVNMAHIKTGGT